MFMLGLIKWLAALSFAEILGSCLMGNHFHLLVKILPDNRYTDADINTRLEIYYGQERDFANEKIPYWCKTKRGQVNYAYGYCAGLKVWI
jgi:putative transposase